MEIDGSMVVVIIGEHCILINKFMPMIVGRI